MPFGWGTLGGFLNEAGRLSSASASPPLWPLTFVVPFSTADVAVVAARTRPGDVGDETVFVDFLLFLTGTE